MRCRCAAGALAASPPSLFHVGRSYAVSAQPFSLAFTWSVSPRREKTGVVPELGPHPAPGLRREPLSRREGVLLRRQRNLPKPSPLLVLMWGGENLLAQPPDPSCSGF